MKLETVVTFRMCVSDPFVSFQKSGAFKFREIKFNKTSSEGTNLMLVSYL